MSEGWPVGAEVAPSESPAVPSIAVETPRPLEVVPVPWSRVAWTVARDVGGGAAAFWSVNALMGEPTSVASAAMFGVLTRGVNFARDHAGKRFPAAPSMMMGGLLVATAAALTAFAARKGEAPAPVYALTAMIALGGIWLVSIGWRARRDEGALIQQFESGER